MNEYESLSHTTWDCKYHVVFIPKCRRKTLYQDAIYEGDFCGFSYSASASGRSVPQACASEGIEGRRRAFDARSCAHAAVDPAEIRGVAGGRFHQGQERDPHGSG